MRVHCHRESGEVRVVSADLWLALRSTRTRGTVFPRIRPSLDPSVKTFGMSPQ